MAGIPAAEGIVEGTAHLLDRRRIKVPQLRIDSQQIDEECQRFRAAVRATDQQLRRIQQKLAKTGGVTLILEAHRLIVSDPYLVSHTLNLIRQQRINAEWALRKVVKDIRRAFDEVDDQYFAERRSDVDFGARQLLVTLMGDSPAPPPLPKDAVVVAYDLSPADIARLHRDHVSAFITDMGGPTSHTAIMARSFGMAAVVGLQTATSELKSGNRLIVDGDAGEVIIHPDSTTVSEYRQRTQAHVVRAARLARAQDLPAVTRDGQRVRLMANVGLLEEIPEARERGVDGIGLYRMEFSYLGRQDPPTEDEHCENARQVFDACGSLPVVFRTFDLGGDKVSAQPDALPEPNPAMGLRAIRLALKHPESFANEIRGLVRAAEGRPLRIMFPMISSLMEFRTAQSFVDQCVTDLGIARTRIELGILVETPAAALIAADLAREADFLAIGTNDLIQYTLAVDRLNERVSHLYTPLHPAVLGLIRQVVRAGQDAGKPVSVCGEMAGDPQYTLVLLGLGVRELSMAVPSLPVIRRTVRAARLDEAEQLVERLASLHTAREIAEELRETTRRLFPTGLSVVPTVAEPSTTDPS